MSPCFPGLRKAAFAMALCAAGAAQAGVSATVEIKRVGYEVFSLGDASSSPGATIGPGGLNIFGSLRNVAGDGLFWTWLTPSCWPPTC